MGIYYTDTYENKLITFSVRIQNVSKEEANLTKSNFSVMQNILGIFLNKFKLTQTLVKIEFHESNVLHLAL